MTDSFHAILAHSVLSTCMIASSNGCLQPPAGSSQFINLSQISVSQEGAPISDCGTLLPSRPRRAMSVIGCRPADICSLRVFRMTPGVPRSIEFTISTLGPRHERRQRRAKQDGASRQLIHLKASIRLDVVFARDRPPQSHLLADELPKLFRAAQRERHLLGIIELLGDPRFAQRRGKAITWHLSRDGAPPAD